MGEMILSYAPKSARFTLDLFRISLISYLEVGDNKTFYLYLKPF